MYCKVSIPNGCKDAFGSSGLHSLMECNGCQLVYTLSDGVNHLKYLSLLGPKVLHLSYRMTKVDAQRLCLKNSSGGGEVIFLAVVFINCI